MKGAPHTRPVGRLDEVKAVEAARRQVRLRRAAAGRRAAGVIAETVNAASRKAILALAESPRLDQFVRRHGMRFGAARFVAGETLDQLVPVLRRLNEQGLLTNTTLLGEGVRSPEEAGAVVVAYREVLDRIAAEGLRTNVALKLTHLGLSTRRGARVRERRSSSSGTRPGRRTSCASTWRSRQFVDATLRIYRRLREAGHENVGTVLQSYLYRTRGDLESLLDLRPNLRLVKGAYLEPPDVRLSREGRRRRRLRPARRALAARRRLHRDRDARRAS